MALTSELPLLFSAFGIAIVAILRVLPRRQIWTNGAALAIGLASAIVPLVLFPFIPAAASGGRALWQWSAIGGPSIQAAYRLDGVGAIGASAASAYVVGAIFAATRGRDRHPLLVALLIAIGHTTIALAVTADLIASIVLLGVLAAFTATAAFLVSPPPAAARGAAFLAVGVQCFVLAALLISRFGGASFQFEQIFPTAISPGIVLAASLGAALFAGLYPFVPWRYLRPPGPVAERETLRGLLAMPAGLAASLVLLRLVGVTRGDVTDIGMPALDAGSRTLIALGMIGSVGLVALRRRVIPGRSIVAGIILVAAALGYADLHWSSIALACALLTILYATAASLALPDEWDVARHDVTLAALWIGIAMGTPVSLAAALAILATDALVAVADSVWLPPHRGHIVLVTSAVVQLTALGVMGVAATDLRDGPTTALALLGIVAAAGVQLAHLSRRIEIADPPMLLDATSSAAAFLTTMLLAIVLG
ncbi:MAG: hypothetical protein FJ034_05865, partial [Chloroflexi bacterium]|nr:hypothetical protein [Chloroflexota bacterium]